MDHLFPVSWIINSDSLLSLVSNVLKQKFQNADCHEQYIRDIPSKLINET